VRLQQPVALYVSCGAETLSSSRCARQLLQQAVQLLQQAVQLPQQAVQLPLSPSAGQLICGNTQRCHQSEGHVRINIMPG
jgi:hypothetical protein